MDKRIQWWSEVTHVDIETGEIILQEELKGYIKVKTNKTYEKSENGNGKIKYVNEWRRSRQLTIF